jgi:VCBS repeat-containing protein
MYMFFQFKFKTLMLFAGITFIFFISNNSVIAAPSTGCLRIQNGDLDFVGETGASYFAPYNKGEVLVFNVSPSPDVAPLNTKVTVTVQQNDPLELIFDKTLVPAPGIINEKLVIRRSVMHVTTVLAGSATSPTNLKMDSDTECFSPPGKVSITGNLVEGQMLALDDYIANTQGVNNRSYQWRSNGLPISGANAATFVLTSADIGAMIDVVVDYQDDLGSTIAITSSSAGPILANSPPLAQDDELLVEAFALRSGNLIDNNGSGADSDPNGDAVHITAINGQSADVGTQITLPSGALLTVNTDGTFTYDANGAFSFIDLGQVITDSIQYTLSDGSLNDEGEVIFRVSDTRLPPQRLFDLSTLNGTNGFVITNTNDPNFSVFGSSVSNAGDVNGDGFDDVMIGNADGDPNGVQNAGLVYVVFGSGSGLSAQLDVSTLNGSNGFVLNGIGQEDQTGISISGGGDVNGDGFDDIVIGAARASPNGLANSGQAYVIFGTGSGFPAQINLELLNGTDGFSINGRIANSNAGGAVKIITDINGDGLEEIFIGARFDQPGKAYLFFGSSTGFPAVINLSTLEGINSLVIDGSIFHSVGESVSGAGDVNNDGINDLLVSRAIVSPGGFAAGGGFVVYGRNQGFPDEIRIPNLTANEKSILPGFDDIKNAGNALTGLGDVNGDGIDDFLVAADNSGFLGRPSAGSATVVFGKNGSLPFLTPLSASDGSDRFVIVGANSRENGTGTDKFGRSVSGIGDFNNDGLNDMLIGAPFTKNFNIDNAGAAYVVYGSNAGFPSILDVANLDGGAGLGILIQEQGWLGEAVGGGGDINGDGIPDIIIGARLAGTQGGEVYVIFGGSNVGVVNTPPIAQNDGFTFAKDQILTANVLVDNGNGPDTDPEAKPLSVSRVNGFDTAVGTIITLASGARITIEANGDLTYDTNRIFDALGDGQTGTDVFTYAVSDGTYSKTAAVSISVTGFNNAPTGALVLSGSALQGNTLNADASSIRDQNGLGAFSYQWRRGGTDVTEATASTYTLVQADVGSTMDVVVSYADVGGANERITSSPTDTVVNVNDPPAGELLIIGTVLEGQVLSADTSNIIDLDGLGPFTFQWFRDGIARPDETNRTYTLTQDDVGVRVFVRALYVDGFGTSELVNSVSSPVVKGLVPFTITLSGLGEGVVNSAPTGLDCGSICSFRFTPDSTVTLSQSALPGSSFSGWGGDCSGKDVCELTMDQERTVDARFEGPTTLFSSVLPSARSGSVNTAPDAPSRSGPQALGDPITVFASVVNAGASAAQSCTIKVPANAPVSLSYQLTDAANAPVGPADASFDVAPAQARSFILSLTPLATNTGVAVFPDFVCDNANVDAIPGVNTVFLSIDNKEVPDILSIGATASGDGIIAVPSGSVGLMTASAINIGVGDAAGSADTAVTVSVDNGAASLPLLLQLCELDAGSLCITPLGEDPVSTIIGDNASFFAVFVTDQSGGAGIALDPANARVFLRFTDAGGTTRSVTSAAISIPVAASADAPQRAASLPEGRWAVMVRKTTGIRHAQTPGVLYVWPDGRARLQSGGQTTALSLAPANDNADAGTFTGLEAKGVIAGQFVPNRALFLVNQRQNTRLDIWGVHDTRALNGEATKAAAQK